MTWKGFPGEHSCAGPTAAAGLGQAEEEERELAIPAGTPERAERRRSRVRGATGDRSRAAWLREAEQGLRRDRK